MEGFGRVTEGLGCAMLGSDVNFGLDFGRLELSSQNAKSLFVVTFYS